MTTEAEERQRQYAESVITRLAPPSGKRSTRTSVAWHLYVMARRSKRGTIRRYFIGRFLWRGKIREVGLGPASMKTFDKVRKHLAKLIASKRTKTKAERHERERRSSAASRRGLLTRAVNRMHYMEAYFGNDDGRLRPALWQRRELVEQLERIYALIRIEDEAFAIFQAEKPSPKMGKSTHLKEQVGADVPSNAPIGASEGTAQQPTSLAL